MRKVLVSAVLCGSVAGGLSAGTITVDTTLDVSGPDGMCSLREAITLANNNGPGLPGECAGGDPGPVVDVIEFALGGGVEGGISAIQPTSPLPAITDPLLIDGYSQLGAAANTLPIGNDAVLVVELDGSLAGPAAIGLALAAASAPSEIRGLVINRFDGPGIGLTGAGHHIHGNFIGTDRTGDALSGTMSFGVLANNADDFLLGGEPAAQRNVIAGGSGVNVSLSSGQGIEVLGNYIGTDRTGTLALGSNLGVRANGLSGPGTIGSAAAPNVISGHTLAGVALDGGTQGLTVHGNYIGTDVSGTSPLPNEVGVSLTAAILTAPSFNQIGEPGGGNVIAYNLGDGIRVTGLKFFPVGNRFSANSIFANGDLGIDLGDDGETPNDPMDPDPGPNNLQNKPSIDAVGSAGGMLTADWSLASGPSDRFSLEFFYSPECDPASSGVARQYLGAATQVSTDPAGLASGAVSFPSPGFDGFLSATATAESTGDTSEISDCVPVGNPFVIPTLDRWGFALLAILLAAVGRIALRRAAVRAR